MGPVLGRNNTEVLGQRWLDNLVSETFDFSMLIIDYGASIEDVYSSFVKYLVKATASLNVLSLCHQEAERYQGPGHQTGPIS